MKDAQLAWTFTTAIDQPRWSDPNTLSEPSDPPTATVEAVDDRAPSGPKIVRGTITGPLHLEVAQPVARLRRSGVAPGTMTFPFTVVIPRSVLASGQPGRAVLFGHEMFGSRSAVETPEVVAIAEQLKAVMFAIDFFGTTKDDAPVVRSALAENPARVIAVSDVMMQALGNWRTLTRTMTGVLSQRPELMQNGAVVYDASTSFSYLGTGHFLDATIAAPGAKVGRLALAGGALSFSAGLFRTTTLDPIKQPILDAFSEPLLAHAYLAMTQPLFDRFDPAVVGVVARGDVPSTPPEQRKVRFLLHVGAADTEVPNEGSLLLAQVAQASQTTPSSAAYSFLKSTSGNEMVDAVTFFDYGKRVTATPGPPPPNGVHQQLRTNKAAIRQLDAFLKPNGVVIQPCDGPCDPE
jgi:hypothetical protein